MSLKKIEDALKVLGYTGELVGFDLASEEGYCTIKLKVSKVSTDISEKKDELLKENIPEIKVASKIAKPVFGSMSNRQTLSEYIANGGITDIKKTESIPTPIQNKEEKRPRIVKRHIFFKKYKDAENFVDRYSEDFGLGKVKRTVRTASETHYEIKHNTIENELYKKGYGYVLIFSMNGLDFGAIEDLENLERYHSDDMRCVRLYRETEKAKVV